MQPVRAYGNSHHMQIEAFVHILHTKSMQIVQHEWEAECDRFAMNAQNSMRKLVRGEKLPTYDLEQVTWCVTRGALRVVWTQHYNKSQCCFISYVDYKLSPIMHVCFASQLKICLCYLGYFDGSVLMEVSKKIASILHLFKCMRLYVTLICY